ncbi:hypothetical protein ExPCM15_02864 [Escherichia coli]|nr:hypothetical protein ExPCM15_02864 [Escherichia coli]
MHYRRVSVRLPARICAFCFGFRTCQFTQRIQHAHYVVFTAVDQRTDQAVNFYVIVGHGHHTDVQGGFDHTFCHVGVADHTVRGGVQQTNKGIARFRNQGSFIVRNRVQQQCQIFLFLCQFVFQDLLIGIHQRFQGVDFISCDSNGRKGFTRDGVTQCAAVEINKTQVQFFCMTRQEAHQQFVGITQANVDFTAGVTAFQTF